MFKHHFITIPQSPAYLLGRHLLAKFGIIFIFWQRQKQTLPLGITPGLNDQTSQDVDPVAWYNVRTNLAVPVVIKLKGPSLFPIRKQYLIKEAYKGFQPSMDRFLKYGFLQP